MKELVKHAAAKTGMGPLLYRLYGWFRHLSPRRILSNRRIRRQGAPDGLPIPPDHLIFLTSATRGVEWFLRSGRAAADSIREVMERIGHPVEELDQILDFGCGCGRVLRNWHDLDGPKLKGCDYNLRSVQWVSTNLSFVDVTANDLRPPLPYDSGRFDLVYALSVMTHLTESLQQAWIQELHRVIRPRGFLIITTHGDGHAAELTTPEQDRYLEGNLVVRDDPFAGTNICAAYHPEPYVRNVLARNFDVVAFYPEGAVGNPHQDLYLLRKQ